MTRNEAEHIGWRYCAGLSDTPGLSPFVIVSGLIDILFPGKWTVVSGEWTGVSGERPELPEEISTDNTPAEFNYNVRATINSLIRWARWADSKLKGEEK